MKQYATVHNFAEALMFTERGRQAAFEKKRDAAALAVQKPIRMTKCHDGVWRLLIEAPKFKSGGFHFNGTHSGHSEPVIKFKL